jgi:RHS repeat-associated protein
VLSPPGSPGPSVRSLLSDGATSYLYGPDGLPIEQISNSGSDWYVHDATGSTRALLSSTGAIAGSYGYDAYGNATHTGAAATPLQYGGGYLDSESGLLYLRARYYDPVTEQFLTVDPQVTLTRTPTPLNAIDPSGASIWGDFEEAADDVGDAVEEAAPIAIPVITDVVVDAGVEIVTEGAGTAALPEIDEAIDGAEDSALESSEASGEAASDTSASDDDTTSQDDSSCAGPGGNWPRGSWNGSTELPSGKTVVQVGRDIWGNGKPAADKLAGKTAEELRGLASLEDAQTLNAMYSQAAGAITSNETAPVRVTLTQQIIDAWEDSE